jgi:Domain of unknown function (DUF6285)
MEHAVPTPAELIEAVREFLTDEVRPATTGRVAFLARVAANVLAIVERELELGPAVAAEHRERLARLGMTDDAELAAQIRAGALDDRIDDVVGVLRASSLARVRIANPRWLTPEDAAGPETTTE